MSYLDICQYREAVAAYANGRVDYLIPSEIYTLADRFDREGFHDEATILRMLLTNRWALA